MDGIFVLVQIIYKSMISILIFITIYYTSTNIIKILRFIPFVYMNSQLKFLGLGNT